MSDHSAIWHIFLGKLDYTSFPIQHALADPTVSNIIAGTAAGIVVAAAIGGFALITFLHKWRYLWSEWITSLDHKKIGIMYIIFAVIMMMRGVIEGILMRTQQDLAVNKPGILAPDHFAQFFTTHGTIMIFFVVMPLISGIINFAMPMQIGARDVAFPFLNSIGLWLSVGGGILVMASLAIGEFSTGGWSGYPPYTELAFNSTVGPDYWIWSVTLSSMSAVLTGMNFAVTVYKLRCPGMTWMRLPLFTWTAFVTSILMIFAMPPLTVATMLLAADRYMDMHFFTNDDGGNMMMFINLFWLFGHPEVYILILPSFGVFSEVVSTYSSKELYSYIGLVCATAAIGFLSFSVWLHHFFTMAQSPGINVFFGVASMLIGIPTGVKIYNWTWTMFMGRVRYTAPMLFTISFLLSFTLGGLSGIWLAQPTLDFMTHNTLFLVAHFHNVLIPGTLFGLLAGLQFWWPKAFGYRLEEKWGRRAVLLLTVGFYAAFMPLYVLGLAGAPRRMVEFHNPAFAPWLKAALAGALLLGAGFLCLVMQIYSSFLKRDSLRVPIGDPWDGRSLEWSTQAPFLEYNFARIPVVEERDAFHWQKVKNQAYKPAEKYEDIVMPKNSPYGFFFGMSMCLAFFGLVWHIWLYAAFFGLCAVASGSVRAFKRDLNKTIPASEVEENDRRWLAAAAATTPVPRMLEESSVNKGMAICPET